MTSQLKEKQVSVRVSDEMRIKLKLITTKQGTSIQKVLEPYLKHYVEKNEHILKED